MRFFFAVPLSILVAPSIVSAIDAVPTLFSVKDTKTGRPMYATENFLYEELLRNSSFIEPQHLSSSGHYDRYNEDKDDNWRNKRKLLRYNRAAQANDNSFRNPTDPLFWADTDEVSFHNPLTISWHRSHDIDDDDVIAVYCPAHETDAKKFRDAAVIKQVKREGFSRRHFRAEYKTTSSVPFSLLRASDPTIKSTSSWYVPSFPIVREDTCEFRLWKRNRVATPMSVFSLQARTGPIRIKDSKSMPTGIHLSLTGRVKQMRVHFTTGLAGTPVVTYVEKNRLDEVTPSQDDSFDKLANLAEGTSQTYKASDMCLAPANIAEPGKFSDPGMIHEVILRDLKPNTEYLYKVGLDTGNDDDIIKWSDVYTFTSSLQEGSSFPYSFIVYGDQGCPPHMGWESGYDTFSSIAVREITNGNVRLIHHIGDLSYADGAGHNWDAWLEMIQSLATRVPLMVAVGNHEYDHSSGGENGKDPSGVTDPAGFYHNDASHGECGVPYAKRFSGTNNGNGVFWYSYEHGMVHYTVISSEHNYTNSSDQYVWLEKDLQSVNRTRTPWLILETHAPMYNAQEGNRDDQKGTAMRDSFEHLLFEHKVDLVLAGHNHLYLRTCPGLYQSKCHNGGPMHATIGTGGTGMGHGAHMSKFTNATWREVFLRELGYGKVTVVNETALHWQFITDQVGEVMDDIWLWKK